MILHLHRVIFLLLPAFIFLSCDDLLPTYQKPENILEAGFTSIDTSLIKYSGWLYQVPVYRYTESSPYNFILQIRNRYTETIQSTADIQGKLEIWVAANPALKATIPLTSSNALLLNSPAIFNPVTGILTLNPNQKLFLKTQWNFKMDDGHWINEALPNYNQVVTGMFYTRYHDPAQMHIRLTVGVIKNTSPLVADTVITIRLQGSVHEIP